MRPVALESAIMIMYLLIKTFQHFARDNTWSDSKYFEQLRTGKQSEYQALDSTFHEAACLCRSVLT